MKGRSDGGGPDRTNEWRPSRESSLRRRNLMERVSVALEYLEPADAKEKLFMEVMERINSSRADLQTLYCHLCMPDEDVGEVSDGDWANNNDTARLLGAEDTDSPSASSSQATEGSEFMSNAVPEVQEISLSSRSSCRGLSSAS
ncbi:hypothetical protein EDB81DRAFT_931173 [Dactylonectria macrodidyma]|uniref:Uncharacterized protein n=1 Tax=Dactylonectria macrodidyma TaxID=307937 RepID=A0A9P9J6C9_9HYPO|nr:hypothetical protein EDB81DRAFT_931173 [Dactylonectria macrodidyma]